LPEAYKTPKPKLSELIWDWHWQQIHYWDDYSSADGYTWPHHQDCAVGIKTGVANSYAWCCGPLYILGPPHSYTYDYLNSLVNFDREIRLVFWLSKQGDDPESESRVMLMAKSTYGAPNPPTLDALGFGILLDNLTLKGESYGSGGLGQVDLGVCLIDGGEAVKVEIIHYPGKRIEYWIDDVLRGTQTDLTKIPSGTSSAGPNAGGELYVTLKNGATGGIDLWVHCTMPLVLQEPPINILPTTPSPPPPTLTKVATLTLAAGESYIHSSAVSEGYLYEGLYVSPGKVVKIDLSTFTEVGTLTLDVGEDNVEALAVSGGYLYAGLRTDPGKIVKIDLSTFTKVSTLTLASEERYVSSLAVSGGYLYAGLDMIPGKVVKVDLSTFSEVSTLTLAPDEDWVACLLVSEGYLYAGLSTYQIAKIDLSTFTEVAALTPSGEDYVEDLEVWEGYLYASIYSSPPLVVKIDLATFTEVDALVVASTSAAGVLKVYGGYLYGLISTTPAKLRQINLTTFKNARLLTFASGEKYSGSLEVSGSYLYAGLVTSPAKVVKVAVG
jgi:hypothetical protein